MFKITVNIKITKMNVLSLFDGMSCGQIALDRVGIKVDNYFASEIDKSAIKVTQYNYPKTIQLGDVVTINYKDSNNLDLVTSNTSRFVVYNIEYTRKINGPDMTLYLAEV